MTEKEKLIAHLNDLRAKHGMPAYDPEKVKMTTGEIEQLIHTLENERVSAKEDITPPTTKALLIKLNVLRVKRSMPAIKTWKESRKKLEEAITRLELDRSHVTPVVAETKIAKGANTSKHKTALHKNHLVEAIGKMDKKERRAFEKEQKEVAGKIALAHGFHTSTVLEYLKAGGIKRPTISGEALAKHIREFVKTRESVGIKTPKSAPKAAVKGAKRSAREGIHPGTLAEALSRSARDVRVLLRRREKDIPKAWRIEGERWGFKPEHKADIVQFLGGKS